MRPSASAVATLYPPRSSVASDATDVPPSAVPSPAALPSLTVPAEMASAQVNVLAPFNSSVPAPVLVIVPAALISPLMVIVPAALISTPSASTPTLALIVAALSVWVILSVTPSVPAPVIS